MHRWLTNGVDEVSSEVYMTTGSGLLRPGSTGNADTDTMSNDTSLKLWLSISIPLLLLLVLGVGMFFFCKRGKRPHSLVDTETGSPSLPMHHLGRRRGTPNNKRAVLTTEDEEALASWKIDAENIVPINPLGAGAYGTVWLATYLGETVVVKKLSPPMPASLPRTKSWRKSNRHSVGGSGATTGTNSRTRTKSRESPRKSAFRRFVAEIRFLATLSHPTIVAFYGVAWNSPSRLEFDSTNNASDIQMVLEFMSGGDLRQYLAHTRSDVRARGWGSRKLAMALDIVEALSYLHSRQPKPVLHRDLKSRNILLDSTYTAKVADFGVSRYGIPLSADGGEDDDDSVKPFSMTRSIGTNRWIAPEVLSGDAHYSTAVDIYSFGVILSELDSHELPFSDVTLSNGQPLSESAVVELLRTGAIRPSLSDRCPRGVAVLMMECLRLEPALRPTAAQVADRLRALLERERRVSDIGDDVSTSDQNSFLGVREDFGSIYSNSISSNMSGFNYAVLEEREATR